MTEQEKVSEKSLYQPICSTLIGKLSLHLNDDEVCHIEITASKISEKIKQVLPDETLLIMGHERRKPDLIGYIQKSNEYTKRIFIVEVKNTWLTFQDLYQTKMYAEMINAQKAFLISPFGFARERIIFLKRNYHMLGYNASYGHIAVLKYINSKLEVLAEISGTNPFVFR